MGLGGSGEKVYSLHQSNPVLVSVDAVRRVCYRLATAKSDDRKAASRLSYFDSLLWHWNRWREGCSQENRGVRQGTPVIGDCVWIGVNATIVGKIIIGDNVLIAPNSYAN